MSRNEVYHKILYFYFQDYLFSLPKHSRIVLSRPDFAGKIYNIFVSLFLFLKEKRAKQKAEDFDILMRKHWVFVFAPNNYEATKFLKRSEVIFVTDHFRKFRDADKIIVLPAERRLSSFLRFFNLLFFLRKKEPRAMQIFDLIFNSLGWYESFDALVKKYKPLSVTFSNDHSVIPRALLFAAKANSIPTIYIQHATVTDNFPPLEFDLSLLEGEDALHKYSAKGSKGKIKLIGMPRFDAFVSRRKTKASTEIRTIGMAFNSLDSITNIVSLVKNLIVAYPDLKIIIRKHQKDKRDFVTPFSGYLNNVSFSDAGQEDPFDFILRSDLLLAGNSSIHLDARLLNVQSLFYDFDRQSKISDMYGFLKRGFVKEVRSDEELIRELSERLVEDNYLSAKYYNAAVGEPWEGSSATRAREELDRFYSALTNQQ